MNMCGRDDPQKPVLLLHSEYMVTLHMVHHCNITAKNENEN